MKWEGPDDQLRHFGFRGQLYRFAACGALGVVSPLIARLLPGSTPITLVWLLDLALHWQWLYVVMLFAASLGLLGYRKYGGAALIASLVCLPLWSAAPRLDNTPPGLVPGHAALSVAIANLHFANSDTQTSLAG